MSLHTNKRLWQKHVLAENRRSIEGLLATLCAEPVYEIMATGEKHLGQEGVAQFYTSLFEGRPDANFELVSVTIVFPMRAGEIIGERLYFDLGAWRRQFGLTPLIRPSR